MSAAFLWICVALGALLAFIDCELSRRRVKAILRASHRRGVRWDAQQDQIDALRRDMLRDGWTQEAIDSAALWSDDEGEEWKHTTARPREA